MGDGAKRTRTGPGFWFLEFGHGGEYDEGNGQWAMAVEAGVPARLSSMSTPSPGRDYAGLPTVHDRASQDEGVWPGDCYTSMNVGQLSGGFNPRK